MPFTLRALALCAAMLPLTVSAADDEVARGKSLYEATCAACHSPDAHGVGPLHRGVLGRTAGKAKGYDYSPALAASKLVWTRETLQLWLTNPEALIPDQRMNFRVDSAEERAAIISYLASLSS
jgi:cytochrome c